jgi:GntR family transcriptional regulator
MMTELKKTKGVPLYLQIKDLLKSQIQDGTIKGKRLAPVRKVAQELNVNPNTVLRAYNELGKEGLVSGAVGRGTFVTTSPGELKKETRSELLGKSIERALAEALSLEFSIEEFAQAVKEYVKETLNVIHHVRLVFIECNIEQLLYFTEHLELDPHIQRCPVLLADIRSKQADKLDEIRRADIIVTSFYHLDEVRQDFQHMAKPIIGINLEPEVKTLIEIAKIPPRNTVGIVTSSEQCRKEIKEILENSNISFAELLETNSKSIQTIQPIVRQCQAVLVSPRQKEIVEQCVKPGTKVIEFVFSPDKTSINNLKVALLDLKKAFLKDKRVGFY